MKVTIKSETPRPSIKSTGMHFKELEDDRAKRVMTERSMVHTQRRDMIVGTKRGDVICTTWMVATPLGRIVAYYLKNGNSIVRVFSVNGIDGVTELSNLLEHHNGWVGDENAHIRQEEMFPAASAILAYEAEGQAFGERLSFAEAHRTVHVDESDIQGRVDARAIFMSQGEVVDLVQTVADEYGLIIDLELVDTHDETLGLCGSDSYCLLGIKENVYVRIQKKTRFRHIVLHELAHAIEMTRDRHSAHGKTWQDLYNDLLSKYHNGKTICWD